MARSTERTEQEQQFIQGLLTQAAPTTPVASTPSTPTVATPVESPARERTRRRARPDHTGVFKQSDVKQVMFWLVRFTAWVVLLGSGIGSIQAIAGRWPTSLGTILADWPWYAIVIGLVAQGIVTGFEWSEPAWVSWKWWLAMTIDVLLTYLGYASLLLPWLSTRWTSAGITADQIPLYAGASLLLLSVGFAFYPEQVLIKQHE